MMNRPWEDLLYPNEPEIFTKPFQTELGGLSDGFRSDFWLRGYKILGEMTGKISFVQALALCLTGRLINKKEDRLLNTMFVNNALVDYRFWLFRTARLAANVKSPPSTCLSAGILVNDGSFLASGAAYHTSSFFYEVQKQKQNSGHSLKDLIQEKLKQGEIIGGFGRVLARGEDERNPSLLKVAEECGLANGIYLDLAFSIEKHLQELKNPHLHMNSAGLGNALLLDLGFTPQQIMLFASFMFVIGMSGNILEAYERPPGEFSTLTDKDIVYTGPKRKPLPVRFQPKQTIVDEINGIRIVIVDSVSFLTEKNRNDIVICGSHGGLPAAKYALSYSPKAIVFNDAGVGKDDAGIEGLAILDKAGIPTLTISADSARIGDGMDMYQNGIVSSVNKKAAEFGVIKNMTIINVINALTK